METDIDRAPAPRREIQIPVGRTNLAGELKIPNGAEGVVLFAHGSGSSRHSPRNQYVAKTLREAGLGTLLFDLLTREEEIAEAYTRHLRFNIGLLASRLVAAAQWVMREYAQGIAIGFFGASTGAGAALVAAAELGESVGAVVSRGGRPDLAGEALRRVTAPTLLIVGERDEPVIELNQQAFAQLGSEKELRIVPRATHLFEEPGTLEEVARLAADWFLKHLRSGTGRELGR
jgi:predicted alpha/beta-hydrolase family hydrolase